MCLLLELAYNDLRPVKTPPFSGLQTVTMMVVAFVEMMMVMHLQITRPLRKLNIPRSGDFHKGNNENHDDDAKKNPRGLDNLSLSHGRAWPLQ